MKKCAIVYKDEQTGEEFWACSYDERGATYCLRKRKTVVPSNHYEATEFYGARRLERAQKQIERDAKLSAWTGRTGYVVEFEDEPEWYFELLYVLNHAYGDRGMSEVRKSFPLNPDVTYKVCPGHSRPFIQDLTLAELQRYYEWRKTHFKGKPRSV